MKYILKLISVTIFSFLLPLSGLSNVAIAEASYQLIKLEETVIYTLASDSTEHVIKMFSQNTPVKIKKHGSSCGCVKVLSSPEELKKDEVGHVNLLVYGTRTGLTNSDLYFTYGYENKSDTIIHKQKVFVYSKENIVLSKKYFMNINLEKIRLLVSVPVSIKQNIPFLLGNNGKPLELTRNVVYSNEKVTICEVTISIADYVNERFGYILVNVLDEKVILQAI